MRSFGLVPSLAIVSITLVVQAPSQDHPVRGWGTLDIPQTFQWNLDNGTVWKRGESQSPDVFDFWYEAASPTLRYLVPLGGATLAIAGEKAPGYAGCVGSNLSEKKIDFQHLRRRTFVCDH